MKAKKCSYKYCKELGEFDPDNAVNDNGKYYHLSCYEKKEAKNQVFNMFCSYVTNDENGLFIRKKLCDYIDNDGFSPSFMQFTMQYIIKNNIPLKSIWGLKKVMQQKRVINAYNECLEKYHTPKINVETQDFTFNKDKQGGWRDLIG